MRHDDAFRQPLKVRAAQSDSFTGRGFAQERSGMDARERPAPRDAIPVDQELIDVPDELGEGALHGARAFSKRGRRCPLARVRVRDERTQQMLEFSGISAHYGGEPARGERLDLVSVHALLLRLEWQGHEERNIPRSRGCKERAKRAQRPLRAWPAESGLRTGAPCAA